MSHFGSGSWDCSHARIAAEDTFRQQASPRAVSVPYRLEGGNQRAVQTGLLTSDIHLSGQYANSVLCDKSGVTFQTSPTTGACTPWMRLLT